MPSHSITLLALPSSAARVSADLTLIRSAGRRRADAAVLAHHAEHVDVDVERQVHLLVAEAERAIVFRAPERGLHHALAFSLLIRDFVAVDRFDPLG